MPTLERLGGKDRILLESGWKVSQRRSLHHDDKEEVNLIEFKCGTDKKGAVAVSVLCSCCV